MIANIHALSNVVSKINGFNGPFMEEEDISKTKSLFSSSLVEKELEFLGMSCRWLMLCERGYDHLW